MSPSLGPGSGSARRGGGRDGFTLIETLVAIAVVAAVSVSLQRGVVSARQALGRAEAVAAAESVARDILENRLAELAPTVGTRRGEDRGLGFDVKAEPLDLPFPAPPPDPNPGPQRTRSGQASPQGQAAQGGPAQNAPAQGEPETDRPAGRWTPLRVTIRVSPASGPPLIVETVHVAPAP